MSLEIQIGADASEFNSEVAAVEERLQRLNSQREAQVRIGADTSAVDRQIATTTRELGELRRSLNSTGQSMGGMQRSTVSGSNALTQFSRVAQDAPFGIMGIGNNLTSTAEAFASLSQQAGGARGALQAVGASLMGTGGILLAVSLVTTALTVMSQKGLTVGDVFDKLTGNFDEFGASLKEANKEAAKNAAEQVASVGAYVSAAKDINLSMQERLIAVKKLQDEYPAFFGNLTKEQILNGNVSTAVKEVTEALKAKARAQAYAGKLGDLASKEVDLREKETELIEKGKAAISEIQRLKKEDQGFSFFGNKLEQQKMALLSYQLQLKDIQDDIRANSAEMDRWAAKSTIEVKASIKLDFDPEKAKKLKKVGFTPEVDVIGFDPEKEFVLPPFDLDAQLNKQYQSTKFDPFASLNERIEKSNEGFIKRIQNTADLTTKTVYKWKDTLETAFGGVGESIGQALASGGNVLEAVGMSLIDTLGGLMSTIGKKLIELGVAAVAGSTVLATLFTPAGMVAGIAAIGVGTALVAGGSLLGGLSKGGSSGGGSSSPSISTGGSVSSPTSSISNSSSSGGLQNVVFEISGQSLVGVLSNTLNKNVKLGGVPAI